MKEALFGISLKSCGHIFAKKGRRIDRPVGREDWLLFYVAKGTEAFTLKDGDANAPAGSFIFYRPGEPQSHRYFGDKTGEFYYIHFTAPEDFSLFGFESSRIYRSLPSLQINELFEEVIREVQTKEYGYEKISISRFFSLICLFERRCRGISEKPKKHEGEISAVIQIMNKEYYVNYTLSDYAEMARMSKYYFLRTFKEITGSPLLNTERGYALNGRQSCCDLVQPRSVRSRQALGITRRTIFRMRSKATTVCHRQITEKTKYKKSLGRFLIPEALFNKRTIYRSLVRTARSLFS